MKGWSARVLGAWLAVGLMACAGPQQPPPEDKGQGARVEDFDLGEPANDKQREVQALKLFRHAQSALAAGDAREAAAAYREALKHYEVLGDKVAQAAIHNDLGLLLQAAGKLERAQGLLEQAVALARQGDQAVVLSEAQLNLGLLHYRRGQDEAAEMVLTDALETATRAGDQETRGMALNGRGNARRRQRQHLAAMDDYRQALEIWEKRGKADYAAVALMNVGYCQVMEGRYGEAEATFQRAIETLTEAPAVDREALGPHLEGLIRQLKADPKEVKARIEASIQAP